MSSSSPSKKLHHNWLVDLTTSIFCRPDNKIAVVNKMPFAIIAILSTDPNERRSETTSKDYELDLEGSITDISAKTGLKGSVQIEWSDKTVRKDFHPIGSGSQWIFNTDYPGNHYLTILKGTQVGSSYPIIGASAFVPLGYEFIVAPDIPIIEGLTVPAVVVKRALNVLVADVDDDKHDTDVKHDKDSKHDTDVKHDADDDELETEVLPFDAPIKSPKKTEKSEKSDKSDKSEKSEKSDKISDTLQPLPTITKKKFTTNLVGTSMVSKPDYKHFLGLSTEYKIDVVNQRSHPIYVILSSKPDKPNIPIHHEGVVVPIGTGTTFTCHSKMNELTVIIADNHGECQEDNGYCNAIRWKKTISIGKVWTANDEMLSKKYPLKSLEQFI